LLKKTSIYLDEELDHGLARRAAEEGITKAELIRRTLTGLVERPQRGQVPRRYRLRRALTVVVDTSFILALVFEPDEDHAAALAWIEQADEELVTSPLTLAELDHMVPKYAGEVAQHALWDDFDRGVYTVRWWADALSETLGIARRRPFLGLTDASLVALSGRLRTNRIATFDQHFRSVLTPDGEAFVVLPADR
jgi:predicted nucleic acid-binding protein